MTNIKVNGRSCSEIRKIVLRVVASMTILLGMLGSSKAEAQRPTEGGVYAYSENDRVVVHDVPSGLFRVHYSMHGPQQTLLEDLDGNEVPDFVEAVGESLVKSWSIFHSIGFRRPIIDREHKPENTEDYNLSRQRLVVPPGETALGGSDSIDVYLVDFQGGADGIFGIDFCREQPLHCAGWIGLENDFAESSYPSLQAAIDTVASHELFHAIQAAYHGAQPIWFSEGTAVWAQEQIVPESRDFLRKCDAYLELGHRPLYAVPSGPVQGFAYGTALFWWFLHERHLGEIDVALQHVSEFLGNTKLELVHRVDRVLMDSEDSLSEAWFAFVQRNLATGFRSSEKGDPMERYPFAEKLEGVQATVSATVVDHQARFAPLAANYYHLLHPGGPLAAGLDVQATEVRFALFPVTDRKDDGPVIGPVLQWDGSIAGPIDFGFREAGGYWIVASNVNLDDEWVNARFCAGISPFVKECLEGDSEETVGIETGQVPDDTDQEPSSEETGAKQDTESMTEDSGCSCRQSTRSPSMGRFGTILQPILALCLLLAKTRTGMKHCRHHQKVDKASIWRECK